MNGPFGALLSTLAIAAAIVAIVAGPDYGVSLPSAVVAVALAGSAVGETLWRTSRTRRPAPSRSVPGVVGVRAWLRRGRLGREEVIVFLDRLDRGAGHPDLPIRPPAEIARLVNLPEDEFRAYVRFRLDAIEGTA